MPSCPAITPSSRGWSCCSPPSTCWSIWRSIFPTGSSTHGSSTDVGNRAKPHEAGAGQLVLTLAAQQRSHIPPSDGGAWRSRPRLADRDGAVRTPSGNRRPAGHLTGTALAQTIRGPLVWHGHAGTGRLQPRRLRRAHFV